jgi:hypothetical protein
MGAVALVYLALARTAPHDAFWMPDAGVKFLEMLHLTWRDGRPAAPVPNPAAALDPGGLIVALHPYIPWYRGPDGDYYGSFPVWFPVLAWPWYRVFGLVGLVLLPALAGLAACWLAGLIAERLRPGRGWIAVLLTGVATPVLFYSQVFWEHTPALAAAMFGMYLLVSPVELTLGRLGVCLLLFGLASLLRREMVAPLACVAVFGGFVLWRHKRLGRPLLAALPVGAVCLVLLERAWAVRPPAAYIARVLSIGQRQYAGPGPLAAQVGRHLAAALYNNPAAEGYFDPAWQVPIVAAFALALGASRLVGWPKWALVLAATGLAAVPAAVNAFSADPIRSVHGIVLSAPILLAALAHVRPRAVAFDRLFLAVAASLLALQMVTTTFGPTTALEWGSRLALLVFPLAMIVLAKNVSVQGRVEKALAGVSLAGLVTLSVATQARGVGQLRSDTAYLSRWTQALEQLPPGIMVTDLWWLTMATAPAFERHQFVYVDRDDTARYLANQPVDRTRAIDYVGLRKPGEGLPEPLRPHFDVVSSAAIPGGPGQASGVSLTILRLSWK